MPTLEQIRATFSADRFATQAAGCEIRLAEPGHAVCAMTLESRHRNAAGTPQGGAVFTLADFAFAVAGPMPLRSMLPFRCSMASLFCPRPRETCCRQKLAASAPDAPPAFIPLR